MRNLKGCGLFLVIVVVFGFLNRVFCAQDSPLDLERIVITKNKIHLLNIYSLELTDIKNLSSNFPLEVLSFSPLDLQSRSPKGTIQTDFSLRGSNFQGVLLLLNGQRINDPQTGHHNSDIPLTKEDIERIEVIPGASSSLFGPDAIAGAVNLVLKKPKDKKLTLETSFGQHQTRSSLFSISDKIDDFGLRLSLENQESEGFREDTDFKKLTAAFNSILDIPYGEFGLNFGYQQKEFGAYDFYTPGMGFPSKEWTKTYLLNAGLNLDKYGFIIKPNFLWRRHYDKFMLDKSQVRSRYLNHHRTDLYTPNIYFQGETGILGRAGLGLEYGQEQINSTNLGKHSRSHKSIFIDDSKDLDVKLSYGLSLRMDDFEGFRETCTGSSSLRYRLSKENSVNFGVSRSMRVPSFTELFYNDPTTVGDSSLSAEKAINYQVGCNYKKERLCVGATFFFREERDMIDWVKRTANQAKWKAQSLAEAEVFGIESCFKRKVNKYLTLDSNYTYINKRIDNNGYLYKYGPNYIKHLSNTIFSLDLPFGVQTITLAYKKKPSRDGWFLLNTRLSYNINKVSQVFLTATNSLNVEYQDIEGIPQPGRWVEAGLRFEW
jgi:iron complex outermembrane receptor protein